MLPSVARKYLFIALQGMPATLKELLRELSADDERWDVRPDPERFSLREIVAHLASIEPNWAERTKRICHEEQPSFESVALQDERIASNSPLQNLDLLQEGRTQFVELLRNLKDEEWERTGLSSMMGVITVEQQAVFVLTHDGYHSSEVTQWLQQMS